MARYITKEIWNVSGEIEHHSVPTNNPEKYIKNWIEGWEESCEENGYEIEEVETDNKTFANIRIKTSYGIDEMQLTFEKQN
mgnify:CR=1 FL=1